MSNEQKLWRADEPPKDRNIIVIGKLKTHDEFGVFFDSVHGAVRWSEEFKRWQWLKDGISVALFYGDTLIINFWADFPADHEVGGNHEFPEVVSYE